MSSPTISPAPIRRSLVVAADLHRSFRVFTDRIGSWWPRSKSIASSPQVEVIIEPRTGGRWYERAADGSECEWGKVLEWEPPARLVLAWQIDGNWKYNPACVTEVELNFTRVEALQTRVDFEHRCLERLGSNAAAIRDMLNSGWPGLLDLYAAIAQERVFVALGTNLGDDLDRNLRNALQEIGQLPQTELLRVSSFFSTEPWGAPDQPRFLNAVAEIRTGLEPLPLLQALKQLETKLGRVPTYRWGPRVIDFDIILYGQRVVDLPELRIPHPQYQERDFVMQPLAEIAPEIAGKPTQQQ
jgi:2-amino-4-hydroxy-6-hydroxymethyldihydropteridine diphosphokinase